MIELIKCTKCNKKTIPINLIKSDMGSKDVICPECGKVSIPKYPKWVLEGKTPKQRKMEEFRELV